MQYKTKQTEQSSASKGHRQFRYLSLRPIRKVAIARCAPYVFCALLSVNLCSAAIEYQVTSLSQPDEYQYNYFLTGISLGTYEGFDIQFDAGLYETLSSAPTPDGFTSELFQPNNPPGVEGDYIVWATVNDPPLTEPFSVDFTYLGPGQPGSQFFTIEQFDQNGDPLSTIQSGVTSAVGTAVPEPSTMALYLSGLLCLIVFGMLLRRRSARELTRERSTAT